MKRGEKLTAAELAMSVKEFAEANAGRWFYDIARADALRLVGHVSRDAPGWATKDRALLFTVAGCTADPGPGWTFLPGLGVSARWCLHGGDIGRAILEPGDEGYTPEPQWRALTAEERALSVGEFVRRFKGWEAGTAREHKTVARVSSCGHWVMAETGGHGGAWKPCDLVRVRPPQSAPAVTVQAKSAPMCSSTSAHGQCAKVKGHDASHRNADATHFWDGEPRDYLYLPSPAPDRAVAIITSYASAAKAYANSLPFADARAAADKAAWDNLLKHADAACRYLAGQVHPGELTAYRREREGLVRELVAAIRTVKGEGVPR